MSPTDSIQKDTGKKYLYIWLPQKDIIDCAIIIPSVTLWFREHILAIGWLFISMHISSILALY